MTTIENNLALHIVKQEFGEVAKIIAGLLIKKKCCPFQMICKELEMEKRLVRDLKNQNRFILKSIKIKGISNFVDFNSSPFGNFQDKFTRCS